MAHAVYGNIIVEQRGSIAGNTYSRNKSGNFVRARVKGNNPQTSRQVAVRQRLSVLSQTWRTLDKTSQRAWEQATPEWQYVNKVGQLVSYTGQQLFMALNSSRLAANPAADVISVPPTPVASFPVRIDNMTAETNELTMTSVNVAVEAEAEPGFLNMVFCTPGLSAGVTRPPKSKFRFVQTFGSGDGAEYDITSQYNAIFGNAAPLTDLWAYVKQVNANTGQTVTSGQVYVSVIVA